MSGQNKHKLGIILLLLALFSASAFAATFSVVSATYAPAPSSPGKLVTIYATIKNTSNVDSDEITVTVKPSYPFSLSESGKSSKTFATLLSNQTAIVPLEVQVDKAALNGTYSIEIQIMEKGVVQLGSPLNIHVLSYKPQVEIIESTENTAAPGAVLENRLILRNIGSSTAKNVFVGTSTDRTVTSTGVVVETPIKNVGIGMVFVENLEPGETREIEFPLGVDSTAEQKTYLVPVKIQFQDENRSEYEATRYIGVTVQGDATIDGSLSQDSGTKPFPNGNAELSVNLFNRGTATAKNVVIEVKDSPHWRIDSEQKVFIGTLDPDDFDSFTLNLHVNPDTAPGSYPLELQFEYKNQNNQNYSITKTLMLQVLTPGEAQSNGASGSIWDWLLPLILIVVILYFAYRWYKGRNTKGLKR